MPGPGLRQPQFSSGRWGQIEDVRDPAPGVADGLAHPAMHGFQLRRGNQATVDGRLVGNHNDRTASARQAGNGIQAARNKAKLRPAFDVGGGVGVDDAVAVEKDGFKGNQNEYLAFGES
jgi:hypothetical protein